MTPLIYNYFSSLDEWNQYIRGNWAGKGISMIPSESEPYETNQETRVNFQANANKLTSRFRRDGKTINLKWAVTGEILSDRIFLEDEHKEWRAEIQTMTENKFHLHVLPSKDSSKILFSGIVIKRKIPFFWF